MVWRHQEPEKLGVQLLRLVHDNTFIHWKSQKLNKLVISESKLTTQTLSSVTNIINLKFLKIECVDECDDSFFAIPSAIGNMTNLERLHILNCWRSRPIGPIPHEVGALKKLESLVLRSMGLSGRIPSTIANLTQLIELQLSENYLSGMVTSLAH